MDAFITEVLSEALAQGLWAALAIGLIYFNLRIQNERDQRQDSREDNYQQIIMDLSKELNALDDIKLDIQDLKNKIQ